MGSEGGESAEGRWREGVELSCVHVILVVSLLCGLVVVYSFCVLVVILSSSIVVVLWLCVVVICGCRIHLCCGCVTLWSW